MNRRTVRHIATAAAMSLAMAVAGCNSDGEAEEPERCFETTLANCGSGPWDPFGIALAFAWWSGQCTEEVACAADAPQTDLIAGIVTDSFIRSNWTVNHAIEREPNDSREQAMAFLIENDGSFQITGLVEASSDAVDYLVFKTESSDLHAAYLCRTVDECMLPFYQGDALYIELYDANGSVLKSTRVAQTANGHEIVFEPIPALHYFIAVHAVGGDGSAIDYKLVITD